MDATTSKRVSAEDRISNLPEHILHHILSFLPTTTQAVGTSVLSTRWKFLWTSISSICLSDYIHGHQDSSQSTTLFMNFVERVLLLHNVPKIHKFTFSCQDCDPFRFNTWISTILGRNVRELFLFVDMKGLVVLPLPSCLFSSESLTTLEIHTTRDIEIPTLISFPSLKILHLEHTSFFQRSSPHQVSFNCPVLREFGLNEIHWLGLNTVKILTPVLESLIIHDAFEFMDVSDTEIEVYAESLISLELTSSFSNKYSLYNLSSLVDATIVTSDCDEDHYHYVDLLQGIRSVKDLTLGSTSIEIFSRPDLSAYLRTFSGLTHLTVALVIEEFSYNCSGRKLINILRETPNIESLRFPQGFDDYVFHEYGWPDETKLMCFLPHLKVIELGSFSGNKDELCFVKFFLKNVGLLKKMNINMRYLERGEREKIILQLQKLAEGSSCVMEFC